MVIVFLVTQLIPGLYGIDRATITLTICGVIFLLGALLSVMRRTKG